MLLGYFIYDNNKGKTSIYFIPKYSNSLISVTIFHHRGPTLDLPNCGPSLEKYSIWSLKTSDLFTFTMIFLLSLLLTIVTTLVTLYKHIFSP